MATLIDRFNELESASENLTPNEQVLYMHLILAWNRFGREDKFYITNRQLLLRTGIVSEKTIIKARQGLKDKGIIDFVSGKKGQASEYSFSKIHCKIYSEKYSEKYSENYSPIRVKSKEYIEYIDPPLTPHDVGGESEPKKTRADSTPYQAIADKYNEICGGVLPNVQSVTNEKRRRLIKRAFKQHGMEGLTNLFIKTAASSFLTGKTGKWNANFDWVLNNADKVLEGNYDDRSGGYNQGATTGYKKPRYESAAEEAERRRGQVDNGWDDLPF